MTITDVQWVNRGTYRCISPRYKGLVDLQVLVPVRELLLTYVSNSTSNPIPLLTYVSNITSGQTLILGNDVDEIMIICTTNCAYPTPTISWFENDQPFNGNAIAINTESGCAGDRKGLKRALSSVRVSSKYMFADKRNESKMSCVAENLIGEPKISRKIDVRYKDNQTDSPEKHEHATIDDVKEERQGMLNKAVANAKVQDAWFILLPLGISIFTAETSLVTRLNDFVLWLIVLSPPVSVLTLLMVFATAVHNWFFETPADDQAGETCNPLMKKQMANLKIKINAVKLVLNGIQELIDARSGPDDQVRRKADKLRQLLDIPPNCWLNNFSSAERHFLNISEVLEDARGKGNISYLITLLNMYFDFQERSHSKYTM